MPYAWATQGRPRGVHIFQRVHLQQPQSNAKTLAAAGAGTLEAITYCQKFRSPDKMMETEVFGLGAVRGWLS